MAAKKATATRRRRRIPRLMHNPLTADATLRHAVRVLYLLAEYPLSRADRTKVLEKAGKINDNA